MPEPRPLESQQSDDGLVRLCDVVDVLRTASVPTRHGPSGARDGAIWADFVERAFAGAAHMTGNEPCLTCGDRGWIVLGHLEDGTAEQVPCPDCDEYELRQRTAPTSRKEPS